MRLTADFKSDPAIPSPLCLEFSAKNPLLLAQLA